MTSSRRRVITVSYLFRSLPGALHRRAAEIALLLFLAVNRVRAPRLLAADELGDALVEYVEGVTLADAMRAGTANDATWRTVGAALAAVHAARFPSSLEGDVSAESIQLTFRDPIQQLPTRIDNAARWVTEDARRSDRSWTRFCEVASGRGIRGVQNRAVPPLHVCGALGLFAAVGIETVGALGFRRAPTVDQVRTYARVVKVTEPLFPVFSVLVLGAGIYMTVTQWSFRTPFVIVGLTRRPDQGSARSCR